MADSSLDDIIKKRNIRPLMQQLIRPNPGEGIMNQQSFSNFNTTVQVVGDARNRIIQKKRMRFTDARERLAEIAKQGDARDRINKIRKNTGKVIKTTQGRKNIGANPVQKQKIRNENQPSQLNGRTQMQGSKLMRTVKSSHVTSHKQPPTVRKKTVAQSRITQGGRTKETKRSHPIPNNPHVFTIQNDIEPEPLMGVGRARRGQGMKYASGGLLPTPQDTLDMAPTPYGYGRLNMMRSQRAHQMYRSRSPVQQPIRPTRLKITTPNNYREPSPIYEDKWEPARPIGRAPVSRLPDPPQLRMAARPMAKKRPMYEDEENDMGGRVKKMNPLSSGMLARLDQSSRSQPPQGYKVLVTNLHPCVSVEDMEELFGTIGPILTARMLRQGVAEALFVTKDDAYRSVEVFNHRQLDGQPMCVNVVGRQAINASRPHGPPPPPPPPMSHTTSVLKAASGGMGGSAVRGMSSIMSNSRRRPEDMPAPNLAAIHQALFNHPSHHHR